MRAWHYWWRTIALACLLPMAGCAELGATIPVVVDGMVQMNKLIQEYRTLDPSAGTPTLVCEHEVTPPAPPKGAEIDMLCSATFPPE